MIRGIAKIRANTQLTVAKLFSVAVRNRGVGTQVISASRDSSALLDDKLTISRAPKAKRFMSQPFHIARIFTGLAIHSDLLGQVRHSTTRKDQPKVYRRVKYVNVDDVKKIVRQLYSVSIKGVGFSLHDLFKDSVHHHLVAHIETILSRHTYTFSFNEIGKHETVNKFARVHLSVLLRDRTPEYETTVKYIYFCGPHSYKYTELKNILLDELKSTMLNPDNCTTEDVFVHFRGLYSDVDWDLEYSRLMYNLYV